ncbi:MAG: mannosyltransferase family protein [Blastocatellia bacterium]
MSSSPLLEPSVLSESVEDTQLIAPRVGIGQVYRSAVASLIRASADSSLRATAFVFVLTRALVFLVLIITTHTTFKEPPVDLGDRAHEVRIAIRRYSIPQKLRDLATRSDGAWYIQLAKSGYEKGHFDSEREHNWAFFPLYPLTVRAVASFTGNYRLVGIALSNLFFLLALIVLHKLVLAFKNDNRLAGRTIFYVAAFPTSYFFSLPWTTSLFLLLTVSCFLAAKRGVWWLAGACAGLASATRYNGIFLFPTLMIFYWQSHWPFRLRANLLWLLLAPAGLLAFMGYLYLITGNAFAFADAQAAWKVRWGFFLQPLATFIISPFELSAGWNFRAVNFAAAILALACGVAWLKRREWAWAFYIFISVITPLATVTLEGHTRYVAVLFPVFLMLAVWGRSPWVDQTVRTVFLVLLTLMTAFFGFFLSPALI